MLFIHLLINSYLALKKSL